ncbi:FtsQ-type POTRA domain-containing protein [Desulfopila sp. IMCC35006]|nr:FtsQ-type POTRA domain-containing protein [Desulfopila sp. IMCC35006]
MTMFLSKVINNISSFFVKKKKNGAGYLKSELSVQSLPGQSGHYPGRKSRLARLRQLFSRKKKTSYNNYSRPVNKRRLLVKGAGLTAAALVLLVGIVVGAKHLLPDNFEKLPIFQVSAITYSGNKTLSNENLREASGIILHQSSLVGLKCANVEARLAKVPWIAQAEVKKNWPSTVEISIVENVPQALLHSEGPDGNQLQYIDKNGHPFMAVKPGAEIDFPVITGLAEINDPVLQQKSLDEVLIFLEKINGNNPQLPAQSVSEIHLNQDGEMVVYLVEYPFPIFFGNSNTSKKYYRLVQVLKTLYKQKGKGSISQIEYIQMDYLNDKVLVAQTQSS